MTAPVSAVITRLGLIVAALTFIADQAAKSAVLYLAGYINCNDCPAFVAECTRCDPYPLLPVLNIVMVWNPGVSYGLFPADSDLERWILVTFALLVSAALVYWLWRVTDKVLAIALGFVIGGALGNVIDRILYGAVADFLEFHAGGFHWYVFNVADAGVVVGVALLVVDAFLDGRRKPNAAEAAKDEQA